MFHPSQPKSCCCHWDGNTLHSIVQHQQKSMAVAFLLPQWSLFHSPCGLNGCFFHQSRSLNLQELSISSSLPAWLRTNAGRKAAKNHASLALNKFVCCGQLQQWVFQESFHNCSSQITFVASVDCISAVQLFCPSSPTIRL